MIDRLQTVAMYLPQFHQIPENDEWWGEGYTEWTAVKDAVPLFSGHIQPKTPKNGDYYNLLHKDTMLRQAEYMEKYNIDGLCFYHYYFQNGRKLLEKPAENLLKWKDINIPFCFCWANEGWARTWSNINSKNSWAPKFESVDEKNQVGILVEQKYGREQSWEEHFNYLLPFFQDDRYLRRENMPIFLIYQPEDIPCFYQMTEFWRKLAREQGIPDIYFIGLNIKRNKKGLNAILLNSPGPFLQHNILARKKNGVKLYSYENVWRSIIDAKSVKGIKTYFGGFVNFDDTPRRGSDGNVMVGFTTDIFKQYLHQLYQKNRITGNEYVFLNAWNEWGEGMYLEPDEEYGFQYLEAVKEAKEKVMNEKLNEGLKSKWDACSKSNQEIYLENILNKQTLIANCFDSWMTLRENGVSLVDYLQRHHYNKIAMYGLGILGRHFLFDLERSDVSVAYIIDRRSGLKHPKFEVISVEADLEPVDAIVVTAIADFDVIYETLKNKVDCPILSITELVQEV